MSVYYNGKKISGNALMDSAPTEGSTNAITSGAVYTALANMGSSMPDVTSTDNGKVLMVVEGDWAVAQLPIYNGSTT